MISRRLIKCFSLGPDSVGRLKLSDPSKIGVDARNACLALRLVSDGIGGAWYSTDGDIYAETWTTQPGALVGWVQIQLIFAEPKDDNRNAVTEVKLRLTNGSVHKYWNGSAWVASGVSNWNTVQEVSENISSWNDPKLGFVLNLHTTDRRYTPAVSKVRMVLDVDLPSFMEDWIYRSLIAQMASDIIVATDYVIESPGGTDIDLAAFPLEGSWNIVDAEGAWDYTDDPGRDTNLFSSYTSGHITLSSPIDAGHRVWIRLLYKPVIAVTTSQDYTELDASPSILFETIEVQDLGRAALSDYVMDIYADPPTAVILSAPRRARILFNLVVTAPTAVDLMRLTESVAAFLDGHPVLTSFATDDRASLVVTSPFTSSTSPNLADLQSAGMSFNLENIYQWLQPAQEAGDVPGVGYGVKRVLVGVEVGAGSEQIILEDT